jgi:outer membrane protein, heavy metal efflux system
LNSEERLSGVILDVFAGAWSAWPLLEVRATTTTTMLPEMLHKTCFLRRPSGIAVVLAGAVLSVAAPARAQAPAEQGLSLQRALATALERNPLVVESKLEWLRFQGGADGVAGILVENPVVSAEAGVRRDQGWSGNQASVTARLEQPLDLFGQAGTRRRAAQDLVTAAKSRLALARAEVGARVRLVYASAQVALARVSLGEERLANARKSAEALRLRVSLGASSDIDLRLASAETGRAEAALQQAQREVSTSLLDLRTLLDVPAETAVRPSGGLQAPPSEIPVGTRELLARHVAVQTVEKRRLAVDSELVRLQRERLPRLSLGLAAERPSNQERFVGVALAISPALWRRNQGAIAEAYVERERADYERETTLAALERQLAGLREAHGLLMRELHAIEAALADEVEIHRLVQAGWQAGKFDFLRVVLAERSVAETKQARLALWAELWTNAIEIRRLLGEES